MKNLRRGRAVRTWAEWAEERNGMIAIEGESGVTLPQVNPDILNEKHLQMSLLLE